MAKTPARKPAPNPQASTSPRRPKAESTDFFGNITLQTRLIFAFAFLLYANTLQHGFVLDDGIVITENMYTQQGIKGIGNILSHDTFFGFFKQEGNELLVSGGRYRPLSLVLFACLYQVAGASPFLFHLVTVLLFALTCAMLYRTLLLLLGPSLQNGARMVAWLAAVLFAAHPIHTEVVANIKCCDEILAMLGAFTALFCTLKAWDTGQNKWAIAAGVSFFAACLSKENAAAFVVLIPLALWFFRRPAENTGNGSIGKLSLPILLGFGAFAVLRGSILPWSALAGGSEPMELLNNPFVKYEGGHWVAFSVAEKLSTILFTLWKYVQLLVAPLTLTHDYYPRHIDIMTFGSPLVWLGLAVYGFMGFWAIRGIARRDAVAFGILLYLLPLGIVSNLVFPVGTNMSERFAFLPSVGFCFVAGLLLVRFFDKNNAQALRLFAVVVVLFAIRTLVRNPAWKSNEKLFMTDVAVSDNSVKLQTACSDVLLAQAKAAPNSDAKRKLCQEALTRLQRALTLYPDFKTVYIIRGGVYLQLQQYPEAIADYRKALEQSPEAPQRKTMLAFALREAGLYYGSQKKDLNNAFKSLEEAWQLNPADPETARLMGAGYIVQGKQPEAIEWYQKSEAAGAKDAGALWELSIAYASMGNMAKAGELQQRALALDPDIAQKAQSGVPVDR